MLRASRGLVTAEFLAERFAVSVRTIYRDLDALRDAHFPLQADSGPGGGYALDPSYRLPPINFTSREAALLLSAAEWLERHRLLPFVDTLGQAAAKVRAALPEEQLRQLQPLIDSLSFVGVPSRPVRPEVRRVVERAWYEGRPVRVVYDGHGYIRSERTLQIRNVVVDRAEVLLNCDDLDLGEPRQFRLHQIAEAWLVSEPARDGAKNS